MHATIATAKRALFPARPTPATAPNNNWHRARRTSERTGQRDRETDTERELRPGWGLIPSRSPRPPPPPPSLPPSLLIRSPFPFIECQIMFGWSDLVPKSPGGRQRRFFAVSNSLVNSGRWHPREERKEGREEGRTDGRWECGPCVRVPAYCTCGAKLDKNMTTNVE